jgi:hypothetical protein
VNRRRNPCLWGSIQEGMGPRYRVNSEKERRSCARERERERKRQRKRERTGDGQWRRIGITRVVAERGGESWGKREGLC